MSDPDPPSAKVASFAPNQALPAFLKADEVAALLRVNRKTLYEAVQRGEVPGAFRVGRCLRFHRETVLAWLSPNLRAVPHSERKPG